eukprot:scaffold37611_cov69-Phaeocystis_antarctica.AAC.8
MGAGARDEATEGSKGFAQRTDVQVHLGSHPRTLRDATTVLSKDERGVRLVQAEQRAVPVAHADEALDVREVAVHAEEGIGHDDLARRGARSQQAV